MKKSFCILTAFLLIVSVSQGEARAANSIGFNMVGSAGFRQSLSG
jgi:hypothetical protein